MNLFKYLLIITVIILFFAKTNLFSQAETVNGSVSQNYSGMASDSKPINSGNKGTGYISNLNNFLEVTFLNDVYIFSPDTILSVGSEGTCLKTSYKGLNWVNNVINSDYDLYGLQFLNSNTGWTRSHYYNGTLLKTTNGGDNWVSVGQPVGPFYFISESTGWTAYGTGAESKVLKTTDGGIIWNTQFSLADGQYPNTVYFTDDNTGWVISTFSGNNSRILKTTNGGDNWFVQFTLDTALYSLSFINNSTAWTAGSFGTILKTTNGGNNWTKQNSGTDVDFRSIKFINENTGWSAGSSTIIKTTNGGVNWEIQYDNNNFSISSISCYDINNVWAVGTRVPFPEGIILKSADGGVTWTQVFGKTVSINNNSVEIPQKLSLSQNYPNPFNPTTKINYELRVTNYVSLKVYDVLGNEVASLVNQKQNAGRYEVEFNGSKLASGVYFYKLESGSLRGARSFTAVKKMSLIK